MDGENRGVIKHRDRARQINDFSKMRFCRNITPTDIDGAFEFDGKLFIFYEIKYGEKDLDIGQRLFLERTVSKIQDAGADAIAIHAKHDIHDCSIDVDSSTCIVAKYFSTSRKWIRPETTQTIMSLSRAFIIRYGDPSWLNRTN